MPRALITGVTGQDGSYLAERLVADGWSVHALVRPDNDPLPASWNVVPHRGDLARPARLGDILASVKPDHVFNLAGVSSVAYSWDHPVEVATVNGTGAVALMEAALCLQRDTGREVRCVQASSAEIFGQPAASPQNEDTPIRPMSPYGAAKAFAHLSARVYRTRGLHVTSLILYNHESPRRPDTFVTRKITSAVAAIARGSTTPLRLGNLDARRDWGWAPDVVDAMVRAAAHDEPDDYVIGSGISHTVGQFAAAAFGHVGIEDWRSHVIVDADLFRPADTTDFVADAGKARRILGWAPAVPFEHIVANMVDEDLGCR